MDPNIRDGAAALVNKYGPVPEYVKYQCGDNMVFGKVVSCFWDDSTSSFTIEIEHTTKLTVTNWLGQVSEGETRCSRSWPIARIEGKGARIETATEAEYLMSLILES